MQKAFSPQARKEESKRFLIVKTSSFGDIIQAFNVLDYLNSKYPHAKVDWVVEKASLALVGTHPLLEQAISCDIKGWKKRFFKGETWRGIGRFIQKLRSKRYDAVFDLQGNCKSAVITFLARGGAKVGFGWKSVREKPNLLATRFHYNVPKNINIRMQYLQVLKSYFQDENPLHLRGVRLKIEEEEKMKLKRILESPVLSSRFKVMVCPGSKWQNKQVKVDDLAYFLNMLHLHHNAAFLFMWGNEAEKKMCQNFAAAFPKTSLIVDMLPLPTWQNLMSDMELVLAVDSSALHLCGTTSTPSFSFFGPTDPLIFKPLGDMHYAIQGPCPYKKQFIKQCPALRSCSTGACIRDLKGEKIYAEFSAWWKPIP